MIPDESSFLDAEDDRRLSKESKETSMLDLVGRFSPPSTVGSSVIDPSRLLLEKIPWEGEFTFRSDS